MVSISTSGTTQKALSGLAGRLEIVSLEMTSVPQWRVAVIIMNIFYPVSDYATSTGLLRCCSLSDNSGTQAIFQPPPCGPKALNRLLQNQNFSLHIISLSCCMYRPRQKKAFRTQSECSTSEK